MKILHTLSILLFSSNLLAEPVKIAVIDTGFDFAKFDNAIPICINDSISFSQEPVKPLSQEPVKPLSQSKSTKTIDIKEILQDNHGHGTHVSGVIDKYAKYEDYCQVVIKTWDFGKASKNLDSGPQSVKNLVKAIKHAVSLKVDIINISGGGKESNPEEKEAILEALDKGIVIVAAAGNEKHDLEDCNFFPACYDDRIVVVGATDWDGNNTKETNFGNHVDITADGHKVKSLNRIESGTSMAAASISGFIVSELAKQKRDKKYQSKKILEWTQKEKQ